MEGDLANDLRQSRHRIKVTAAHTDVFIPPSFDKTKVDGNTFLIRIPFVANFQKKRFTPRWKLCFCLAAAAVCLAIHFIWPHGSIATQFIIIYK